MMFRVVVMTASMLMTLVILPVTHFILLSRGQSSTYSFDLQPTIREVPLFRDAEEYNIPPAGHGKA